MHLILLIIAIAIVGFALARGRSLFQLQVENGRIVKTQGVISAAMRIDFEDAVAGVKGGRIIGTRTAQGISLSFRGDFGELTQQRLRNIAGLHFR